MSGLYFISANQDQGARWTFTGSQIRELAPAIRPGTTVSGPYEPQDTLQITLPDDSGWDAEITYQGEQMAFSFRAEDDLASTAGFVLQVLQRLAPDTPAVWFADFVGVPHELRPADFTPEGLASTILAET